MCEVVAPSVHHPTVISVSSGKQLLKAVSLRLQVCSSAGMLSSTAFGLKASTVEPVCCAQYLQASRAHAILLGHRWQPMSPSAPPGKEPQSGCAQG